MRLDTKAFEEQLARQRRADADLDVLLSIVAGAAPAASRAGAMSDPFSTLVRAHKLVPFVARSPAMRALPAELRNALTGESRSIGLRSLSMTRHMLEVLHCIEGGGIDAYVLKGPVLALQAFGDIGARSFIDVDVLIRPSDSARALQVLREADFSAVPQEAAWMSEERLRTLGECSLLNRTRGLAVDLHTALIEQGFTFSTPPALPFKTAATVQIGNRTVRTLSAEMNLAYLCFHSAKHNWAALSYVTEIAALVRRTTIDASVLESLSGCVGTRRMIGLGLLLAERVGGAVLPSALASLMSRSIDNQAIDAAQLAASHWGTARPLWLRRTRRRSLRFPVVQDEVYWRTFTSSRDLARLAARILLRPSPEEWALVDLPRPIRAVYVPLRLARLALREFGLRRPPS